MKINKWKIQGTIALIIWVFGVILSLYVGGWLMFVKPIIACCIAFDTGTLTGTMIGISVLKCIFGSAVGGTIFLICHVIAMLLVTKN
nr:hypothetical protein [Clostridium sp. Marseille-P7770]